MDGDPRGIDSYGARHRDIDDAQDEVYISIYLEYIQKSKKTGMFAVFLHHSYFVVEVR